MAAIARDFADVFPPAHGLCDGFGRENKGNFTPAFACFIGFNDGLFELEFLGIVLFGEAIEKFLFLRQFVVN